MHDAAEEFDGGQHGPGNWPQCPDCGRPRITRCPVCGTAGYDFLAGDGPPAAEPGVDVLHPATAATGCGCGPGGCGPQPTVGAEPPAAAEDHDATPSAAAGSEAVATMLICRTCDEAFPPQYARRCEWCGHEFADGYSVDHAAGSVVEPLNLRMVVVMLALMVLVAAIVAYFAFLL